MQIEEYINDRIDHQLNWYENKAIFFRKRHLVLQLIIILLIPALLAVSQTLKNININLTITVTIILSSIVAVLTVYLIVLKPELNWIQYRRTAEELKREKFNFLLKAGVYSQMNSESERNKVFIERVETLLLSEKSRWLNSIDFTVKNTAEWQQE